MMRDELLAVAVFPGQGSQHRGMTDPLLLENRTSRGVLELASRTAGMDLVELCSGGPEEELARTDLCQISVAAVSLAWWSLLREVGLRAIAVAGHSLGEWCAACAAGSLELEEALALIWRRGKAMLRASRTCPGSMLALLGLTLQETEDVLNDLEEGMRPALANHNASCQVVLSGTREQLGVAAEAAEKRGARCAWLKVDGPFHSPAMREAQVEMEGLLSAMKLRDPSIPFFSGLTGTQTARGDEVAARLIKGMTTPVLWHKTQAELASLPEMIQVEVGPGKVLGRMASRDHPQMRFLSAREAFDLLVGA